ncbi:MAG: hypothetical protein HQK51_03465 [Oligoflexia bacterium]|nr:hypothetical protein [Oligoflexia bacterium]
MKKIYTIKKRIIKTFLPIFSLLAFVLISKISAIGFAYGADAEKKASRSGIKTCMDKIVYDTINTFPMDLAKIITDYAFYSAPTKLKRSLDTKLYLIRDTVELDNDLMAIISANGLHILNLKTEELAQVTDAPKGYVSKVSNNGLLVFNDFNDQDKTGKMIIWNANTRKAVAIVPSKEEHPEMAISADGNFMAILENGKDDTNAKVDILNLKTNKIVNSIQLNNKISNSANTRLNITADGMLVAANSKSVEVYGMHSGKILQTIKENNFMNTRLQVLSNSKVATVGIDSEDYRPIVQIYDVKSGEIIKKFKGHQHDITSLQVLPDGQIVSSAESRSQHTFGGEILIWNPEKNKDDDVRSLENTTDIINNVIVLKDGGLISSTRSGVMKIWE